MSRKFSYIYVNYRCSVSTDTYVRAYLKVMDEYIGSSRLRPKMTAGKKDRLPDHVGK